MDYWAIEYPIIALMLIALYVNGLMALFIPRRSENNPDMRRLGMYVIAFNLGLTGICMLLLILL